MAINMKQVHRLYRLSIILCLLWVTGCGYSMEATRRYADVFHALEGNWKGCAVTTPVGPRPYDIHLQPDGKGVLSGTADTGPVSDHHWSYRMVEDSLHLQFLSTFRGNDIPIRLSATALNVSTVTFRSEKLRKLKVEVTVLENRQDIEVYLHEQPHVSIRLVRTSTGDTSHSHCE